MGSCQSCESGNYYRCSSCGFVCPRKKCEEHCHHKLNHNCYGRREEQRRDEQRREEEKREAQRIKAQRIEAQRIEAQRIEAQRIEAQRIEAQRIEEERVEAEMVEAQRIEIQRKIEVLQNGVTSFKNKALSDRVDVNDDTAEIVHEDFLQQNYFINNNMTDWTSELPQKSYHFDEKPHKIDNSNEIQNENIKIICLGFMFLTFLLCKDLYFFFLTFCLLLTCYFHNSIIKVLGKFCNTLRDTMNVKIKIVETKYLHWKHPLKIPQVWKSIFCSKIVQLPFSMKNYIFFNLSHNKSFHWQILDNYHPNMWILENLKREVRFNMQRNFRRLMKFEKHIRAIENVSSLYEVGELLIALKVKQNVEKIHPDIVIDILEWSQVNLKMALYVLAKDKQWMKHLKTIWISAHLFSENMKSMSSEIAELNYSNVTTLKIIKAANENVSNIFFPKFVKFIQQKKVKEQIVIELFQSTTQTQNKCIFQKLLQTLVTNDLLKKLSQSEQQQLRPYVMKLLIICQSDQKIEDLKKLEFTKQTLQPMENSLRLLSLYDVGKKTCKKALNVLLSKKPTEWEQIIFSLIDQESNISKAVKLYGDGSCKEELLELEKYPEDEKACKIIQLFQDYISKEHSSITAIEVGNKLIGAKVQIKESFINYLMQKKFVYWDILDDHVNIWVISALYLDIINSQFSQKENIYYSERFNHLMQVLVEEYSIQEVETLLYNARERQEIGNLNLDAVSDVIESSITSISIQKCDEPLTEEWIQNRLKCLNIFDRDDDCHNLSTTINALNLSNLTIKNLLAAVAIEKDISLLRQFLEFIVEYSLNPDTVHDILQIEPTRNKEMLKEWIQQMKIIVVTDRIDNNNAFEDGNIRKCFLEIINFCSFKDLIYLLDNLEVSKLNSDNLKCVLIQLIQYKSDNSTCKCVFEVILQKPASYWEETVQKIIIRKTFKEEHIHTVKELIDHISKNSSPHVKFCQKKNIELFWKTLENQMNSMPESVSSYLDNFNVCYETSHHLLLAKEKIETLNKKIICTWTKEDIKLWLIGFKTYKILTPSQVEMISVVSRAIKLEFGYEPRETQLLSLGILLNPNEASGCLTQIPTGEGKSLIVAMLACIHALKGNTVDVVTTSRELSVPEVKKNATFFELFGLTVGENGEFAEKKSVYEKNIVYGTIGEFQGDILRTECQGKDIRGDRKFGVIIVDEVDSMFYDNRSQTTRLSEGIPNMDHLEIVLATIWHHLHLIQRHFVRCQEKAVFIRENFTVDENGNVDLDIDEHGEVVEDPVEFIIKEVTDHLDKMLRNLNDEELEECKKYDELNAAILTQSREISAINQELERKILSSQSEKSICQLLKRRTDIETEMKEIESKFQKITKENAKTDKYENEYLRLKTELTDAQIQLEQRVSTDIYNKKKKLEVEIQQYNEKLEKLPWPGDFYPKIEIPAHLVDFARKQISKWVKSGLGAMTLYQKDHHYIVDKLNSRIVPIDCDNTGVLQLSMVWNNGLSQFLQIKEGLQIQPESVSTNYISTPGFFKRYGAANTIGLTGTMGTNATKIFFKDVYGTDIVEVPPFKVCTIMGNESSPYPCKELSPLIFTTTTEWVDEIAKSCLKEARLNRAVLIICKHIAEVKFLANRLKHSYPEEKIFLYTGDLKEKFNKHDIDSGEIIVATNIAGRGTDITTSSCVEDCGGLHIIITFLPSTLRVELQNAGRTCRQGKKGSTQLILFDEKCLSVKELKDQINALEEETMQKAKKDGKRDKILSVPGGRKKMLQTTIHIFKNMLKMLKKLRRLLMIKNL